MRQILIPQLHRQGNSETRGGGFYEIVAPTRRVCDFCACCSSALRDVNAASRQRPGRSDDRARSHRLSAAGVQMLRQPDA